MWPPVSWSAFTQPGEKSGEGQQFFRHCCLAVFFLNHHTLDNCDQQRKASGNSHSRCPTFLQTLIIKIPSSTDVKSLESQHFLGCSYHCSFQEGVDIRISQPLTTARVKAYGTMVPELLGPKDLPVLCNSCSDQGLDFPFSFSSHLSLYGYVRTCVILLYLDKNFMVKKVSHNWLFIFSYDYSLKH